jgi:hypothetical protein
MKATHAENKSERAEETKKKNVYLPSLMMKVPDHVYILD